MNLIFKPEFAWRRRERLILGVVAIAANLVYFRGAANSGFWAVVLVLVGVGLLNELRIIVGVRYELSSDTLNLVAWPFRWRYPLDRIATVRQGKRWWTIKSGEHSLRKVWTLSARDLAFSSDYLVVEFSDGRLTKISPADKKGFVAALREWAPHAVFEGLA